MNSTIDPADVVAFTADLVRIPSVLGDEDGVARAVVARMKELGYESAEIDDAGNAVGEIRGQKPGPRLLFDGHIDTVGVTPA